MTAPLVYAAVALGDGQAIDLSLAVPAHRAVSLGGDATSGVGSLGRLALALDRPTGGRVLVLGADPARLERAINETRINTGGGGVLCGAMARGLGEAGARVAVLGRHRGNTEEVASAIRSAGGQAIAAASSESAIACASTSRTILSIRIPVPQCAKETGAGGTEFTMVPSRPRSNSIGRHSPAFAGTSWKSTHWSVFMICPSIAGRAPLIGPAIWSSAWNPNFSSSPSTSIVPLSSPVMCTFTNWYRALASTVSPNGPTPSDWGKKPVLRSMTRGAERFRAPHGREKDSISPGIRVKRYPSRLGKAM